MNPSTVDWISSWGWTTGLQAGGCAKHHRTQQGSTTEVRWSVIVHCRARLAFRDEHHLENRKCERTKVGIVVLMMCVFQVLYVCLINAQTDGKRRVNCWVKSILQGLFCYQCNKQWGQAAKLVLFWFLVEKKKKGEELHLDWHWQQSTVDVHSDLDSNLGYLTALHRNRIVKVNSHSWSGWCGNIVAVGCGQTICSYNVTSLWFRLSSPTNVQTNGETLVFGIVKIVFGTLDLQWH